MREREDLQNRLNESTDTEYSLQLIGEILLDIRELLQRPNHCPDCCYVTHGGQPSDGRLRLKR